MSAPAPKPKQGIPPGVYILAAILTTIIYCSTRHDDSAHESPPPTTAAASQPSAPVVPALAVGTNVIIETDSVLAITEPAMDRYIQLARAKDVIGELGLDDAHLTSRLPAEANGLVVEITPPLKAYVRIYGPTDIKNAKKWKYYGQGGWTFLANLKPH